MIISDPQEAECLRNRASEERISRLWLEVAGRWLAVADELAES